MSSTINGVSNSLFNAPTDPSTLPTKTLNQQDFLKLLVAQMSSQDPMNPQSNTDFAAQMAQFTALETSQSTDSKVSQLLTSQEVLSANTLIGRMVSLQGSGGGVVSGTVSAVQMGTSGPQLQVNGSLYDLSQVLSIQPTTN